MAPSPRDDVATDWSTPLDFADEKSSAARPADNPQPGPFTTYFLADEDMVEAAAAAAENPKQAQPQPKGSTYGVQSLSNSLGDSAGVDGGRDESQGVPDPWRGVKRRWGGRAPEPSSASLQGTIGALPPSSLPRSISGSRPSTPTYLTSPAHGSPAPGSPKPIPAHSSHTSDSGSMADEGTSQAIVSSGDEESEPHAEVLDSAPQLIMPSIRMPSRRPFTEKGKNMGRLKALIAGDSGVGKTSLIKSIVQTCEDIVHVDPLTTSTPTLSIPCKPHKRRAKGADASSTVQMTEVYASTKPFPAWWSDFDESKVLRRRKSLGDTVLERNLCFVDTPGYGNGRSLKESLELVVSYVEAQLERTASMASMSDADIMALLSGSGGLQVDVVFFMISQKLKPADIEFIGRLTPLTNVIPIIAQADRLCPEEISELKIAIMSELDAVNVNTLPWASLLGDGKESPTPRPPFAISSATAVDAENMDASLLMSPDYVQPLLSSELAGMVEQVFDRNTVAWLRHCAAKKFVHWWRTSATRPATLQRTPLSASTGSSSLAMLGASASSSTLSSPSLYPSSRALSPPPSSTSYALARVADHTQREDRMAQVRLAKWASDLQRSLQNEKGRFEALARRERGAWLTERLGECVQEGTLAPKSLEYTIALARTSSSLAESPGRHRGRVSWSNIQAADRLDPLGFLRWNTQLGERAWIAVQVVGSIGIVGGLAVWLSSYWGSGNHGLMGQEWYWWSGSD